MANNEDKILCDGCGITADVRIGRASAEDDVLSWICAACGYVLQRGGNLITDVIVDERAGRYA